MRSILSSNKDFPSQADLTNAELSPSKDFPKAETQRQLIKHFKAAADDKAKLEKQVKLPKSWPAPPAMRNGPR
jgi:hypothetical protein